MKLTKKTLIETVRNMEEEKGAYQARKHAGISIERVYQIWNEYKRTGKISELGENIGRPKKLISKQEKEIIKQAYESHCFPLEHCKIILIKNYTRRYSRREIV